MRRVQWLTVALENVVEWPDHEFHQPYDGYDLLFLPETERTPPAIALQLIASLDSKGAMAVIRRFLSALAWATEHPIRDHFSIGAAHQSGVGKQEGPVRTARAWFRLDYLPSTQNPKARLSLALYREALGLNNDAYRFLALFKIINVLHENGPAQKKWINAALPKLKEHRANERLKELGKAYPDLGKYLFESGRCAVAHASAQPVVDPDNPTDTQRLSADLPVIHALAMHLIEHDLGIKSADTVHREHLYQLAGFRQLFGSDLVARLKRKEAVKPSELPLLPPLAFTVRDRLPYPTLRELGATVAEIDAGCVMLDCTSPCGLFAARCVLDFPEEALGFDVLRGMGVRDDGTAHASLVAQDHHRLESELFRNGVLELVDATSLELLARSDPVIPVNMRYDHHAFEERRRDLRREYLLRLHQQPPG